MKTTILILVLNYEETLVDVLKNIREANLSGEILVVCDITKPEKEAGIRRWLDSLGKKYGVRLLYRTRERGYGSAIRFGFGHATGDAVIVMTADNSDEPRAIPKMVEAVENGADIVCGTRFSKGGGIIGNIIKERIAKNISLLMRIFSRTGTYDATNGFRAYRASATRNVHTQENSFAFNIEFLVKAAVHGYKIAEVPTVWTNRKSGNPNFQLKKEGKEYAGWTFYALVKMPSLATKLLVVFVAAVLLFHALF